MANKKDKARMFLTSWLQLAGHDAPQPVPEYHFYPTRKFSADFAFLDACLLVEVDGGQWAANGGRHNRDSDRERSNYAAVSGFRLMRFSTQMLESNPLACVNMVLMALGLEAREL